MTTCLGSPPRTAERDLEDRESIPYREAWGVHHSVRGYTFTGFTAISPICSSTQVIQHSPLGRGEHALATIMVFSNVYTLVLPFSVCIINPYVEYWPRSAQRALQCLETLNIFGMLTSIACGAALAHNHSDSGTVFVNSLASICVTAVLFTPMALTAYRSRTYGHVRAPGAPVEKIYWDAHTWIGALFWTSICNLVISATAVGFAGTVIANHPAQSHESIGAWIAFIIFASQGILCSIWFLALSNPFVGAATLRTLKRALAASVWVAICSLPAAAIAPFWKINIGCQESNLSECQDLAGLAGVLLGLQVADTALRLTLPYTLVKCMPNGLNTSLTSAIHLQGLSSAQTGPVRQDDGKSQVVVESQEQLTHHASAIGHATPDAAGSERGWGGRRGISRSSSRASGVDITRPASPDPIAIQVLEPSSKKQA